MTRPWLSVVMPSYRGEQWIRAALQSLASQAGDTIEVLVIDGSPTRTTLDIAAEFAGRLRLRLFERPDLESWHAKTNFGVAAAEADHLCWLGVDDVWLPGRAAAARRWIDAAPRTALHLAPCAVIDETGRRLGVWRCPFRPNAAISGPCMLERLLVQNFIAAPAPVFRKDAWQACGGLDQTLWYTADWDIWLKLAALGTGFYHDEVTIGFRIHAGSLTTTGSRDSAGFMQQMQTVLDRHLPAFKGNAAAVARAAGASIKVNAALAAAAQGHYAALGTAAAAILALGPFGMRRYFRDSRITERVLPRLRARLSGSL
jgi:glycosyltransferase involved in cell wall biosynthesis